MIKIFKPIPSKLQWCWEIWLSILLTGIFRYKQRDDVVCEICQFYTKTMEIVLRLGSILNPVKNRFMQNLTHFGGQSDWFWKFAKIDE